MISKLCCITQIFKWNIYIFLLYVPIRQILGNEYIYGNYANVNPFIYHIIHTFKTMYKFKLHKSGIFNSSGKSSNIAQHNKFKSFTIKAESPTVTIIPQWYSKNIYLVFYYTQCKHFKQRRISTNFSTLSHILIHIATQLSTDLIMLDMTGTFGVSCDCRSKRCCCSQMITDSWS